MGRGIHPRPIFWQFQKGAMKVMFMANVKMVAVAAAVVMTE